MKNKTFLNTLVVYLNKYFTESKRHIIKQVLSGLFWLTPIFAIFAILYWLYGKAEFLAEHLFKIVGLNPEHYEFLWVMLALAILGFAAYLVGHFIETRLGKWTRDVFEFFLTRIPGYNTIKDLINIFDSSQTGKKKVLVVAVNGFANTSFNVGLMYSQKESIIKDHYTVTISQTGIPNGGYMFEVHKDEIYVLDSVTFNGYFEYLLSMGTKSLANVSKQDPIKQKKMKKLSEWLKEEESTSLN